MEPRIGLCAPEWGWGDLPKIPSPSPSASATQPHASLFFLFKKKKERRKNETLGLVNTCLWLLIPHTLDPKMNMAYWKQNKTDMNSK